MGQKKDCVPLPALSAIIESKILFLVFKVSIIICKASIVLSWKRRACFNYCSSFLSVGLDPLSIGPEVQCPGFFFPGNGFEAFFFYTFWKCNKYSFIVVELQAIPSSFVTRFGVHLSLPSHDFAEFRPGLAVPMGSHIIYLFFLSFLGVKFPQSLSVQITTIVLLN